MNEATGSEATGVIADQRLIELLHNEPMTAMAALYDRYGRLVFSVALRIVGEHELAEEITRDAFVRCWCHAE